MANITYDHQSFSIDGRRIWLISAAIHYPRTPHQLWRKRIRAAKQAGCNCIETYVFWNVHETEPGVFDFAGDRDLRAFIKIVGEEGMFCYLRPGPYICAEWDFGGLPAWLNNIEDIDFRTANSPFLEASARYIGAVMGRCVTFRSPPNPRRIRSGRNRSRNPGKAVIAVRAAGRSC